MRASSAYLRPAVRVSLVLAVTVAFFISYNRFLVDYSLEDLKFALNSIEKNEFKGLDKLFSFSMASAAAEGSIPSDMLANIEYVDDVVAASKIGRLSFDTTDIMRKVVDKKKDARGRLLNVLDAASDRVSRALGLKPKLADRIARNERRSKAIVNEAEALASKLSLAKSTEERQYLLYRIALGDMKALNYSKAISSFQESLRLDSNSQTGMRSLFNKAWCEKAAGRLEESRRDFEDFIRLFPKDSLAKDAEFQLAILYRKEFKYKEAAEALEKLADKYANSLLAPTALYQAAATYLSDLDDEELSKKMFEKLRGAYPLSEFSSPKTFMYKRLFPEITEREKGRRLAQLLWDVPPLGPAVRQAIDTSSTRFVIKMIEKTIEYIELWELNIGDTVKIERTDESLTSWCNKHLDATSKNQLVQVKNVTMRYREGSRIEVRGFVKMGGMSVEGYILGRMELRPYKPATSREAFLEKRLPGKWVVYTIEDCRVGPMKVPPEIVNKSLTRCHKIFNQKLPFEVRRFLIDLTSKTAVWEGPQRVPTNQLLKEEPQSYEHMYKTK